jgi:hypothetical protein
MGWIPRAAASAVLAPRAAATLAVCALGAAALAAPALAAKDTAAPTASITGPSAGATVSGTVAFTAKASDPSGVAKVQFKVDGKVLSTDTSSPYAYGSWDTKKVANGSRTLAIVATDKVGNSKTVTRKVTVSNKVATSKDTAGPTVAIAAPAAGDLSGSVAITATASDPSGVAKVVFKVDGTVLSTDTTSPYAHGAWDSTKVGNGAHMLSAVATDKVGNATTTTRSVTVDNIIAPAPPPSTGGGLPGAVSFRGDYETGTLSQWHGVQTVAGDRITVSASPVAQGAKSGRFEVRHGDVWQGSTGNRAEVVAQTGEREGDDRWYQWSTMFADGYPSTTTGWQIFTQWHATVGGSQPMIVFYASGDSLGFKTVESGADLKPKPSVTRWSGPMNRGSWHTFRLHVKWSANASQGYIELWHNGDKVVDHASVATIIPGYGVYLKQGMYRSGDIGPSGVVYHDGLTVTSVN